MRCGYCYGHGHNRVTCEERKQRVKNLIAGGDPHHYLVREERERETSKSLRRHTTRRCSWCNETGHNRRSCPSLGMTKEKYRKMQAKFRHRIFENMKETGLGVGAIVSYSQRDYDYDKREYVRVEQIRIVQAVRFSQFNVHELGQSWRSDSLVLTTLTGPFDRGVGSSAYPPVEGLIQDDGDNHHYPVVCSPLSPEAVEAGRPSDDWFEGRDNLATLFDKDQTQYAASQWLQRLANREEMYPFLKE